MGIRAITALLFILFALRINAQETAKVTGTVTDENGDPVEIATVAVEGQGIGTIADLKGRYSVTVTSKDSVVLVYSMLGYQTRKKVLRNPKGNITIDVMLPNSTIELGEVTVTESRRQMDMTEQITLNTPRLMPDAAGGGIESLITSQMAGASSNSELSSQYNVRGGSFDENMVYVNGVEVYRPLLIRSGQQEGLSFVNPDMVEGIGFSSGGFDAKYGDKMSSVLDITYKKPTKFEASASASLLGANAYVGYGKKDKFAMTHSIRYKTSQYLLGSLDTKGEYNPSFIDYQTYLSFNPNKKWDLGFIGNFSQNKYNFSPEDRKTNFGTMESVKEFKVFFEGQEKDIFRTYFGSFNVTRHFNSSHDVSLQVSAFRTKEEETYDIMGQYWLNATDEGGEDGADDTTIGVGTYMEHARNYLTATVQSYALTGNHQLHRDQIKWGVEWKKEQIKDRLREWEMRDSAGYSIPHLPEGPLTVIYNLSSKNDISSNRFSAYVQDVRKFSSKAGRFTLTAGIRGSYWDWNKEFIFSPRLSIGFIPAFNEDFTFRAATGIYYQAPFYKEFRDTVTVNGNTTVQLNNDIKSQRSIHFVLAGDYKFRVAGRPFKFSTEVYYKLLNNLVPYNVDNVRISYYGRNMADGYAMGIDMKLFGEFVPGTDSWLTLSIMKTEEKINGKWLPRPTDQRFNISLFFSDYFPGSEKWKMNLKASYADGLPFGPPHSGREAAVFRAPAYRRVDMGMSYRLLNNEHKDHWGSISRHLKNVWLGVDVLNLLDISNTNSYYWVTDIHNNQYAVPNYLTGRQLNARILIEF